jgi:hypothetical protein
MNLVLGDYFKVKVPLISVVSEALEVVKWFNNHSRALGLLRQLQVTVHGHFKSLILPVLTRWTSHYLAISRLLELELYFCTLVLDSAKREILRVCAGDKADQKCKADEIIGIIQNPSFWENLKT